MLDWALARCAGVVWRRRLRRCGLEGWVAVGSWGMVAGGIQGFEGAALEKDLGSQGLGLSHVCVLCEEIKKRKEIYIWTAIGFVRAGSL